MRVMHQADVARAGFLHFFPCTLLCQLQDTFCRTCWSFLICTPAIGRFAERSECGPTIAGFFLLPRCPSRRGVSTLSGREGAGSWRGEVSRIALGTTAQCHSKLF